MSHTTIEVGDIVKIFLLDHTTLVGTVLKVPKDMADLWVIDGELDIWFLKTFSIMKILEKGE